MIRLIKSLVQIFLVCTLFSVKLSSDSFKYNIFNNHGVMGLINIPSARFYDEGNFGVTLYNGNPDQKITLTSSPYNWLEASFFYTNLENRPYCGNQLDPVCRQDYKDKGFNFKIRLKEEGILPAIAVGINDIAGTGYYSSEYIVGSYGIDNLDIHLGLGYGTLNGSNKSFKNPLSYLHDSFNNRPTNYEDLGGQFQPSRYFSGNDVSPFYGISYALNEKFLLKFEHDSTKTDGLIEYEIPSKRESIAVEYKFNQNFTIGLAKERDNFFSIKFIYKQNASVSNNSFKYKKVAKKEDDSKFNHLITSLEANGVGVNKILETADSIGIELTQFVHPNLDIIEEILYTAKKDAGIDKDIKYEARIADLQAYSEFNDDYINWSFNS